MSRTYRNLPDRLYYRRPQTLRTYRLEQDALEQLGNFATNRIRTRANPGSGVVPNAWDDIVIAAYLESRSLLT